MNTQSKARAPKRGAVPSNLSKTGAEYEVLRTSLINGRVVNPGEVVAYDGVPGRYLRPINAAAEKAKKEAEAIRSESRDTVVRTESLSGVGEAQRKLRELDNDRRGVTVDEFGRNVVPGTQTEPLSDKEQKELREQAERTREQELDESQKSGGVLLQMTGTSEETVIPTTGPAAVASQEQLKTAEAKKDEAGKKSK